MSAIGRGGCALIVALSLVVIASCGGGREQASTSTTTTGSGLDCSQTSASDTEAPVGGSDRLLTVDDVISVPGFEAACPRTVMAGGTTTNVTEGACGASIDFPPMSQMISASIGRPGRASAWTVELVGTVDEAAGARFITAMAADARPGCANPRGANLGSSTASLVDLVPLQGLPGSSVGYTVTYQVDPDPETGRSNPPPPLTQAAAGVVAILHGNELLLINARLPGPLDPGEVRALADAAVARLNWS